MTRRRWLRTQRRLLPRRRLAMHAVALHACLVADGASPCCGRTGHRTGILHGCSHTPCATDVARHPRVAHRRHRWGASNFALQFCQPRRRCRLPHERRRALCRSYRRTRAPNGTLPLAVYLQFLERGPTAAAATTTPTSSTPAATVADVVRVLAAGTPTIAAATVVAALPTIASPSGAQPPVEWRASCGLCGFRIVVVPRY